MKKILIGLSTLLLLIALFVGMSISASAEDSTHSGTWGENLTWTFDESTGELIISGAGDMGTDQVPWDSVKPQIKSVKIEVGVTSISQWAFNECRALTNVTIPNSVTIIEDSAFYGCKNLTDITIPDSVTSIGAYAFAGCESLTSITIPDGITSIEYATFNNCQKLKSVVLPNSITRIDGDAFSSCYRLKSITIPNGVTSIGDYTFAYCERLTDVTIPDSVVSIGDYAFLSCYGLESITISNNVTSIGDYAFAYCYIVKSITIPDNLTSIGEGVFIGCMSLTDINIPDSVTSIGDSAFSGCSLVRSITIPNSVTSIGDDAFNACYSVTSFTFNGTVSQWNAIKLGDDWDYDSTILRIDCLDGTTCGAHAEAVFPAVDPTCKNAGCTEGVWCENCGVFFVESEEIPALPHAVSTWECGSKYEHHGRCDACQSYISENHNMVDGICTDCGSDDESICGTSRDEVELQSDEICGGYPLFSPGNYVTWDNVAIADTSINTIRVWGWVGFGDSTPGIYGYSINGGEIVYDESFSVVPEFDPSVTGGVSATRYQVYVPVFELECGTYEIKIFTKTSADKEFVIMTFTLIKSEEYDIPKTGHVIYDTVVTEPSCTEKGYTTYYCHCGYSYTSDEVEALGHIGLDAFEENYFAPTCTEVGGYDMAAYCTVCGAELSREHYEIEALDHDMGEWYQTIAPECTTEGENKRDCGRCDYYETEVVPANGHNSADAVEENRIEPTCTEIGGYDMATYCTVCQVELSREHTEIPENGHTAADAAEENRVEPTCTEVGGYDMAVYCTVCKAELSREHVEIPAKGHAYEPVITDPTCTQKGYTTHTCHCGDTYVDSEVSALGHNSSEWIVDVEAQIGVAGSQHKECTVCGDKLITEPVEALTEASTTEQKSSRGCKGTISASVALLALLSCLAVAWRPRKEN